VLKETTATVTVTARQYEGVRILAIGTMYPPQHLGGYELIWSGVMQEARAQGHEARVLVTDFRRGPQDDTEPDVFRELDWYWRDHAWRRLGPRAVLALERHNAAVLDRHLAELKPDVVTWWPVGGLSLSLIERARRAGVPSVLFVLDPWLWYGPRRDLWLRTWGRLRPFAPLAERLTGIPAHVDYAAAGRWVFCSGAIRSESAAAGLDGFDGTILSPGVDELFLSAPPEPEPPAWRWRLLYAGRVVEQKGVATAVEALALLPAQATLRIVGDGDRSYRAELERLAARLGVAGRVSFEPLRPPAELPEVYRAADVVVFPVQWNEPWGLVPLEAMAAGRPVVATGLGGSGDYLADGENALLFEARDPAALAAAVSALAADPRMRDRLREEGFRTAARHTARSFNASALAEIEAAGAARAAEE
jgi:glycosyltransferase involved in cell wall biosynthesis